MSKPIEAIGIIKESRSDENRTPLVPEHIKKLKSKYPYLNIVVQPSKKRCFSDKILNYLKWEHTRFDFLKIDVPYNFML